MLSCPPVPCGGGIMRGVCLNIPGAVPGFPCGSGKTTYNACMCQ